MAEKSKRFFNLRKNLRKINYFNLTKIGSVHILALFGLFKYVVLCKWQTYVWFSILVILSTLGIMGGSHRLWAHRSYRANWKLRLFYMLLASIANQGSIYWWVRNHRVHHKYSETEADPHNVSTLGFNYWCFVVVLILIV